MSREPISQRIAIAVQFLIAFAIGSVVYLYTLADDGTMQEAVFGALITGYFGMKAIMFIYVWVRFGWSAARSMRL